MRRNKAGHVHEIDALSRMTELGTHDKDAHTSLSCTQQRYYVCHSMVSENRIINT